MVIKSRFLEVDTCLQWQGVLAGSFRVPYQLLYINPKVLIDGHAFGFQGLLMAGKATGVAAGQTAIFVDDTLPRQVVGWANLVPCGWCSRFIPASNGRRRISMIRRRNSGAGRSLMCHQAGGLARRAGTSCQAGARCEVGDLANFPSSPGGTGQRRDLAVAHHPPLWNLGDQLINALFKALIDPLHQL